MTTNRRPQPFVLPYRMFEAVFALSFSLIVLNVVFNRGVYDYLSFVIIAVAAAATALLVLICRSVKQHSAIFEKHYARLLAAFAAAMLIMQLIFARFLRFNPIFDLEAVYRGAQEWVQTGTFGSYTSSTCHTDYFYIFPNNLGLLAFLAAIFKAASLLGITDFFAVATFVNAVLIVSTMVLTSLISRRLFGVAGGVMTAVLFMISPPFYFMAPVFYTDALSLFFPAAAFSLFLLAESQRRVGVKIALFAASAAVCAAGALIKMTVLITAVAVCVYLLVKNKLRTFAVYTAVTVAVTAAIMWSFNAYVYSNHLDRETAQRVNTPVYYWIDLAFHGDGRYRNDIYYKSVGTEDPVERRQVLKDDISDGLKELGVGGLLKLFENKSARAFGDGTYALSDFLDDNPQRNGPLQKFLLYNSDGYGVYSSLCTGIFIALLLFMILSVRRRTSDLSALVPQLCVFGIMLFLLFWEVNSRYITTFIPFIFICAASGIDKFSTSVKSLLRL